MVPEGVVDLLEAVEVQQEQRHRLGVALGEPQRTLHPVAQQDPVADAGQRVVQRAVPALHRLALHPALVAEQDQRAQHQQQEVHGQRDRGGHLQAVVGLVESPRGGDQPKSEDQPRAKQIAHAPQPAVWSADKERQPLPISGDAERPLPHARRDVPGRPKG